jgi:hypothetical protein
MVLEEGSVIRDLWGVFVRDLLKSIPTAERKVFSALLEQRQRELLLDQLICRRLSVSDPRDPAEVAEGLRRRYAATT